MKFLEISGISSLLIEHIDISKLKNFENFKKDYILFYEIKKQDTKENIFDDFQFFCNPKDFNLINPQIQSSYNLKDCNHSNNLLKVKLTIETKGIALYVFIESNTVDFIASDNFFSLKPNEKKIILLEIKHSEEIQKNYSIKEILTSFRVKSLYDLLN
jgi:hypothetical protein